MNKRPELNKETKAAAFRSFYYLKRELVDFCRENGLPSSGSKSELTDRIAYFLDTGNVLKSTAERKAAINIGTLTEDAVIEPNIVCSEKHRAFFREKIGKSFSFNVPFQKWLKTNAGKTYGDAIRAYDRILEEKKQTKTEIGGQFEYNTYIRDFFADNPGKSLHDAIVYAGITKRACRGIIGMSSLTFVHWTYKFCKTHEEIKNSMKIEHIALYVNDLEASRNFFVKYFGATSNDGYCNPKTNFRSYFLSFEDGSRLELMSKPEMSDPPKNLARTGYVHIAFRVGSREKVDELTAALQADGYAVVNGPRTTGDGYYESCVLDAEQNQIEITI